MSRWKIPFEQFSSDSRVVFFTGAGIAAESGIPTFRDTDGLWSRYDPMELASPQGFEKDPELVLAWYAHRRETILKASPNPGHLAISDFQKLFPDSAVITQNVDGLHERAGNRNILELHGNIHRFKCYHCGKSLNVSSGNSDQTCSCGGKARPDVVWFGETLSPQTVQDALDWTRSCNLMFTIGTSTQVYPAAQLPFEAQRNGAFVIEINPIATPFSVKADLVITEPSGIALPKLFKEFDETLN